MKRLFLILALFVCAQAQAQVRVYHVFTPDAKLYIQQYQNQTPQQWIDKNIAAANLSFQQSNMTARVANAGSDSTGICCGANVGDTGHLYTDVNSGTGSLEWAENNPKIMENRDGIDADVVVVVSKYPVDFPTSSRMNCNMVGALAARKAVVGVNADQQGGQTQHYVQAIAKSMCGGDENGVAPARGYRFMTGSSSLDCMVFGTLGTTNINPLSGSLWRVVENSLNVVGYNASSVMAANADMASRCPQAPPVNGQYYSCTAIQCTSNGPNGANCTENKTIGGNTTVGTGTGTYNTFTCSNFTALQMHSNPLKTYLGYPLGVVGLYDNAGTIEQRYIQETQTYHSTKLAPRLKAAADGPAK